MRKIALVVLAVMATLLVLAGCGGKSPTGATEEPLDFPGFPATP